MSVPTLFISDLHLTSERPLGVSLFQRFLSAVAPGAPALYILGDLFEAWVGDDDLCAPLNTSVTAALKQLADSGTHIFCIQGNRDFLLGGRFAEAAGLSLLADPSVIDLYTTPTLISHGDAWCTDDKPYQAFRAQVRDPAWQTATLNRPLSERHAMARAMREQSASAKHNVKPDIMDVNVEAIENAFRRHGVKRMIHGHTHRPARHDHKVDGADCVRWVLPDWYETGGYLACDADGCRLLNLA